MPRFRWSNLAGAAKSPGYRTAQMRADHRTPCGPADKPCNDLTRANSSGVALRPVGDLRRLAGPMLRPCRAFAQAARALARGKCHAGDTKEVTRACEEGEEAVLPMTGNAYPSMACELASPGVPSWNQIFEFLQRMAELRQTVGSAA